MTLEDLMLDLEKVRLSQLLEIGRAHRWLTRMRLWVNDQKTRAPGRDWWSPYDRLGASPLLWNAETQLAMCRWILTGRCDGASVDE